MKKIKSFESYIGQNVDYVTVKIMRFELKMLGIEKVHLYSEQEIVNLYNEKFSDGDEIIGIGKNGEHIKKTK